MFDLQNSALKFQRNQRAETIDATFLGPDWRKFGLILSDKTLEIHAQKGRIFGAKVPQAPRAMCYDPHEACLCVVGNKPLVNRLDLYKGCFRQSYQLRGTQSFDVKYDYNLELLYAATDIGI